MVTRGIVFLNSQTDSQMYTFPDQMNWQFVQILMDYKFQSAIHPRFEEILEENSVPEIAKTITKESSLRKIQ